VGEVAGFGLVVTRVAGGPDLVSKTRREILLELQQPPFVVFEIHSASGRAERRPIGSSRP
jgi:hypothetical protein